MSKKEKEKVEPKLEDYYKIRFRRVSKFPTTVLLPKEFISKNNMQIGDVIGIYLSRSGQLIIKKEE